MSQPDTDATNQALAAAKERQDAEAAKAKLPLATAVDESGRSAGSFSLTSLHAQAVGLHSIKGHVPVELALDTGVHRQWRTFFRAACRKYALLDHLDFDAPDAPNPEWSLLDATVVSWLYGSVSLSILDVVMTPGDDPLAVDLWNIINGLFNDHKINRQLHLTAELGDVKMGEMSMADYLQKVKSLSDGLADLGAPVDDAEMVVHCLSGLSEQYESAADLISLMPGMTFAQCRSLLALQDMKRKNRHARNSDTALFTNTGNPGKAPGKGKKKKKAAAGVTKEIISAPATPQAATPSWPSPQHPWNGAIQMWPYGQGGLLGRAPPGYAPAPSYAPRHTPSPHAFYAQNPYGLAPYGYGYASGQPSYGLTGTAPSSPASTSASWDQAELMHQFQTMGLQAPSREWVMDTGASSHFASEPGPRFSDAIASELSTPSALPLPASHTPSSSSMQHSGIVGLGILGGPSWSH
ncbi:uncharacterized protein [Aegilops tauschii subsp. strangulata]|uniref:uncharacterized protein n=1 Tax=Aegilops tauschii subsp. strangulata TaxID=200361 RepID=UPI00098B388F|nr:uncharacterized protein LOC109775294 [Aegilops tauschii subsp. strangulata]